MKKSFKFVLATLCFVLLMGFTGVYAQITDEKEIPNGYTPIYSIADLYGINNDLEGNYILMADIDMSATAPGGDWDFGNGWEPIGYNSGNNDSYKEGFLGILDGNGYRILNMNIYGYLSGRNLGLFAYNYGKIMNLGMENINIEVYGKNNCIGTFAGVMGDGYILNCYATGNITDYSAEDSCQSRNYIGGIVGSPSSYYYSMPHFFDISCGVNIKKTNDDDAYISGICYHISEGYMKHCIYTGSVSVQEKASFDPFAWRVFSNENYQILENVYMKNIGNSVYGTGLSTAQMKIKSCYIGFDFSEEWFIDDNSPYPYPQLRKCPQVRINNITVSSLPDKQEYSLKDNLDLTGAKINIEYEDDYLVTIPIEYEMCSYSMSKGKQQVVVKYFDKTTSFEIEVGKERPELTIMAQASELEVGEEFTFDADYTGDEAIKFSSSNSKILSINSKTGDAKGIKAGSVIVTITAGDLSKEIEVKVVKSESDTDKTDKNADNGKKTDVVNEDDIEPDFELEVGETFKLAIKKVSSKKLSSSDKNVVTISKKGKVKAIAPGTATITIKDKSTKKVVEKYTVVVLSEEEPDFEIETGETMRIALKSGYTMKSSNENVLSVGTKGKITGIKPGTAVITVYDKNGKEYTKYLVEITK